MIIQTLIIITAFLASILTFFSGFGLGTILLPAFALFFPLTIAVAMTGIVHFTNGVFKVILLRKDIHFPVLWRFALLAIPAAFSGAWILTQLGEQPPLITYTLLKKEFSISPLNLIIGLLMMSMVILEIVPSLKKVNVSKKWLPLGGAISGFFGGLTGHQGAFRSMFLVRAGLSKEQFIATGSAFSFFVDITRLWVYFSKLKGTAVEQNIVFLLLVVFSAISGVILGKKILKKVEFTLIRNIVASGIFLL
ncbi:MAG: sulfite exporter TauE/SafE family protein [Bacteriovoracia bacterium]